MKKREEREAGRRGRPGQAAVKALIAVFWLLVWQFAAGAVDNSILLAGPGQVLSAFWSSLQTPEFLVIILHSMGRILGGFSTAFAAGIFLGAFGWRFRLVRELLRTPIGVLKAIPVASFVVLVLIWAGSDTLSVWVSFLVVFPGIYENTIAGLESADAQLLEMAEVFGVKGYGLYFYIFRPALLPYLISSSRVFIGMGFKSGAAAEVIGMPSHSFGERLYLAKIGLDTAGVLSWTAVLVALSALAERGFTALLRGCAAMKRPPGRIFAEKFCEKQKEACHGMGAELSVRGVTKVYGGEAVLNKFNMTLKSGGIYCLMGASGSGKTTLLRLLMGLEQPDEGEILTGGGRACVVFQEDRPCPEADAVGNVCLCVRGLSAAEAEGALLGLLDKEDLAKSASQLSGGMKRRAAICRAMCAAGDFLLMDEPFNGLDEENRRKSAAFILEWRRGRTLLMTSHIKEDAALLGAEIIFMPNEE